jgi:hypothetical protein
MGDPAAERSQIGSSERRAEHRHATERRLSYRPGEAKQRRLARAVRSEDGPPLALGNAERQRAEDPAPADADAGILEAHDLTHARSQRTEPT